MPLPFTQQDSFARCEIEISTAVYWRETIADEWDPHERTCRFARSAPRIPANGRRRSHSRLPELR
jgi:hypothetical protein